MSFDLFRFEVDEVDDAGETQRIKGKGYPGEELTKVHRVMPHGLASNPVKGSHALAVSAGSRDRVVMLGAEHPDKRIRNVPAGATALYDAEGNIIRMWNDKCEWHASGKPIEIKCSSLTFDCNGTKVVIDSSGIKVTGGRIEHEGRNIGKDHKHLDVTPGGGKTGIPDA